MLARGDWMNVPPLRPATDRGLLALISRLVLPLQTPPLADPRTRTAATSTDEADRSLYGADPPWI